MVEKSAQTYEASRTASSLTPARRTASKSPGPNVLGVKVRVCKKPSMARSSGRTGAVRQSVRTASIKSCSIQYDATAPWAPVQNLQASKLAVKAANNSRSPAVHGDGPRMTSCKRSAHPPLAAAPGARRGRCPHKVPAHSVPPAWRLWRARRPCDQRQGVSAFPCTNHNHAGQCQPGAGSSSRQRGDHLTTARSKTPASPAPSHPGLARPRSQRWNAWPTSDNPHPQPWRPDWQR